MKACKNCLFARAYLRETGRKEYFCTHPNVEKHAKEYEKTHKRITKSYSFIGYKMIKTQLRWCPLKKENKK